MLPALIIVIFLVIFLGGVSIGWLMMRSGDAADTEHHKEDTQASRTLTFPSATKEDTPE